MQETTLGAVASNIQTGPFGSQLHSSDYSDEGTPVIMPQDIVDWKISEDKIARVSEEHVKRLHRHKTTKGDIIYPRRGDLAKCAYITNNEEDWLCGTGCLKVTIDKDKANSQYVYYHLQQPYSSSCIELVTVGSTMPNLNTSILSKVKLKLPSIDIQNRVVEILSQYDEAIEVNRRRIAILEEMAMRTYREWFVFFRFPGHETTEFVDGLPKGWKMGSLDDLAFESGKTANKKNRTNYKYYLPIDCLPRKSLTYTQVDSIENAESSLVSFKKGDILFGSMRPYFHKVVFARDNGLTRTTCFVLNSKDETMWDYLLMLLFDERTIDYATQVCTGSTMPYVLWDTLKRMNAIIPSKEIASLYLQFLSPVIEELSLLTLQNSQLQQMRDRLLPQLMSGQIEVTP